MAEKLFVAALLFWNKDVALVRKNNPKWQTGLWNAIGGKVENGEAVEAANLREFTEETRLDSHKFQWKLFCSERGPMTGGEDYYRVYFFAAHALPMAPRPTLPIRNDADEILGWVPTSLIGNTYPVVGNINWLVPMGMDWRRGRVFATFDSAIAENPSW